MDKESTLREHLSELLLGRSAHIDLEGAVADFPMADINTSVAGSPHTAWQLLEHFRIAQSASLNLVVTQTTSPPIGLTATGRPKKVRRINGRRLWIGSAKTCSP